MVQGGPSRGQGPQEPRPSAPLLIVILYRAALRLYPRRIRQKYGAQMVDAVNGEWARRVGEVGWRGVVPFLWWLVADLSRSVATQQLSRLFPGRRFAYGLYSHRKEASPQWGDRRRSGGMDAIAQDFRHAIRWFVKRPGFLAVAVLTLTLGIGANSALFSVVNGILLRDLPYPEPDRLVSIWEIHPTRGAMATASTPNIEDWAESSSAFEDIGLWRSWPRIVRGEDGSQGARGGLATPDFFRMLRIQPALGRLFVEEDLDPGRNRVIVLSHELWASRYGSDPGVVGQMITMDGESHEIIGVLRAGQSDPRLRGTARNVELWSPLHFHPREAERRQWRGFYAVGRLADGANLAQARQEISTIHAALGEEFPNVVGGWGVGMSTLKDQVVGSVRTTLYVFLGAVGLVLLIACTNIANLLLAGVAGRRQELGIRAAMGADRIRLIRLLLVEGFLLSALGGVGGVVVARWGIDLFKALAPSGIPRLEQVFVDPGTLVFALALTILTTLVFGLVPALNVSRKSLTDALKGEERGHRGRAIGGLHGGLVISEIALALVLLIGSGLLVRSFTALQRWDPGFDQEGVLTVWLLAPNRFETGAEIEAFFREAADRVASLPSVVSTGRASSGPILGGGDGQMEFYVDGQDPEAGEPGHSAAWYDVGPGYFGTLGISVIQGRAFTALDDQGAPRVAMVNESMARRLWPGENPIGRMLHRKEYATSMEVVGVVADVRPFDPDRATPSEIYWPHAQAPRGATYMVIRTTSEPTILVGPVRDRLNEFDPDLQLYNFATMDELVGQQLVRPRFNMTLVGIFGALALVLAAVGIYGVVSRSVAARTREIGIRMALGAERGRVLGGIVREGMVLALIGIVLGLAVSLVATRLLTSMLHGVVPTDLPTYLAVAGVLMGLTLVSCAIPARRASRVDPLEALREE